MTTASAAPAHGGFIAPDVAMLERALLDAAQLASRSRAMATQLGIDDPGDIDLPPASSDADPAVVRTAAPLYLAAELESAALLPAVETYAALFVTGAVSADLGPAANKLVTFWQHRRDRLTAAEREALFGRAFGKSYGPDLALRVGGRNAEFESLMLDLTEALSRLAEDRLFGSIPPGLDVGVRTTALVLATNVSEHARGMASVATTDLLSSIADALAIVKEPALQQSLGTHAPWDAVRTLTSRYLGRDVDVSAHVSRARTGMGVLAWLADALPRVDIQSAGLLVQPADPVIVLAIQWMQATLRLMRRVPASTHGA
jgi:hypothetical protein